MTSYGGVDGNLAAPLSNNNNQKGGISETNLGNTYGATSGNSIDTANAPVGAADAGGYGSIGGGDNNNNNNKTHLDGCTARFVRWWIGALFYLRYPILLTWGFLVFVCALAGANLTSHLKNEIVPPPNSNAAAANAVYKEYWPAAFNTTQYLLYYDTTPFQPFDISESKEMLALDTYLEYFLKVGQLNFTKRQEHDDLQLLADIAATYPKNQTKVSLYSSYRLLIETEYWWKAIGDYFGAGNFSTLAVVVVDYEPSAPATNEFYNRFKDTIPTLIAMANLTNKVSITALGMPSFVEEINESSGRDIVVMFGIVVPIALLIFCWSLDSLRLGILALCSLITTLLGTFAILDGVAQNIDINAVTPGIVGAMCVALSSDFTYMLASKFRREVVLEQAHFFDDPSGSMRGVVFVDPKHVMVMVMNYAGRTVFIAGTSLALASIGLAAFPLSTFSSIGIGCIITALMATMSALVLTPTLLVTFYRFFATGAEHCEWPTIFAGDDDKEDVQQRRAGAYQEVPSISSSDANRMSDPGNNNNNNSNVGNETVEKQAGALPQANAPSFGSNYSAAAGAAPQNQSPGAAAASSSSITATTGGGNQQKEQESSRNNDDNNNGGASPLLNNNKTKNKKPIKEKMPTDVGLSHDAVSRVQLQLRDQRVFYRDFTAFLCQPVVAVISIVIVTALCIYPMTRSFDGNYSNAMDQFVPRDSTLIPAWKSMRRNFYAADIFPYNIIVQWNSTITDNTGYLIEYPFWSQGQDMLQDIFQVPNSFPRGVDSPWFDPHELGTPAANTSYKGVGKCLLQAKFFGEKNFLKLSPICKYDVARFTIRTTAYSDKLVQDIGQSMRLLPTSSEGMTWIKDMRVKLSQIEAIYRARVFNEEADNRTAGNVSLHLRGFGCDSLDLVEFAEARLLSVVAILITIAWVLVTLFFFSIGASLRLLVSLVYTLLTCFGLATIVFVDGALRDWPVPDGLKGLEGGEAWLVPFAVIALNLGTVLNYDVSATVRVQQFRHQGIETRCAIIIAAIEGSNEVFVAAIMTMVSFSGLLFSQVPVMNQLGFFFITGAFLQGVVFRTFLVTPIMSLLGEYNWFPYMQIAEKCGCYDENQMSTEHVMPIGITQGGEFHGASDHHHHTSGSGSDARIISTSGASRPSLLAPPLATMAIEDNEAVIWAVRASGLGRDAPFVGGGSRGGGSRLGSRLGVAAGSTTVLGNAEARRRFSSFAGGDSNNVLSGTSRSVSQIPNDSFAAQQQQQQQTSSPSRPPVEFSVLPAASNQEHQTSSTDNDNVASSSQQQNGRARGGSQVARASLTPGDASGTPTDAKSLTNF